MSEVKLLVIEGGGGGGGEDSRGRVDWVTGVCVVVHIFRHFWSLDGIYVTYLCTSLHMFSVFICRIR